MREAKLRSTFPHRSTDCQTQENEEAAQLRANLLKTEAKLESEEKEASDYQEDMIQHEQDSMQYEAEISQIQGLHDKYDREEADAEDRSAAAETSAVKASADVPTSKISRKEHEKIVIPARPKIHDLEVWKAQS